MILIEARSRKGRLLGFNIEGKLCAKECGKCGEFKPVSEIVISKSDKHGVGTDCKQCKNLQIIAYNKRNPLRRKEVQSRSQKKHQAKKNVYKRIWRKTEAGMASENKYKKKESTKTKVAQKARERRLKNPQKFRDANKKFYYSNTEYMLERARKNRLQKVEWYRAYNKEYRKLNPGTTSRSRAIIKQRAIIKTEEVLREISTIYKHRDTLNANSTDGTKYVVDHVIPIKGKKVCGLHVPWNLAVITSDENGHKLNKFDGTFENESWKSSYALTRGSISFEK